MTVRVTESVQRSDERVKRSQKASTAPSQTRRNEGKKGKERKDEETDATARGVITLPLSRPSDHLGVAYGEKEKERRRRRRRTSQEKKD